MAALYLEKVFKIAQNNFSDPVPAVSEMAQFPHFKNTEQESCEKKIMKTRTPHPILKPCCDMIQQAAALIHGPLVKSLRPTCLSAHW